MDIAIHFSNHRFRFFRIDYAIDMVQLVSQRSGGMECISLPNESMEMT